MKNYLLVIACSFFVGALNAEEVKKPSGDQVLDLNKKIKESREKVATCRDGKSTDPECKKAEAELTKMREEREKMLKNWPEGKGLRKKLRREAAVDRIKARREKEAQDETGTTSPESSEDSSVPAAETPPEVKE